MSSRQKSFFEQEHSNKVKGKWQGKRTFNQNQRSFGGPTSEATVQPAPFKSPLKPSSQSKAKLQAFQFNERSSTAHVRDPEKENRTGDASIQRQSISPEKGNHQGDQEAVQHVNQCPSTPAMRLPLAALVGNAEDALRRPSPKEDSPEEQIGWIANSSHPDLTPGQKRRRAQSSSPISSQTESCDHAFGVRNNNINIDLRDLQQPLKTPKADPAEELWTRYATGRHPDEKAIEIPSFAHLIQNSSPRSAPRTPGGSVAGLRRWASCGSEWPANPPKRRRTHGVFRDRSEHYDVVLPKPLSRVGMLVEKVQEELKRPSRNLDIDAPASSSPLPDKSDLPPVHLLARSPLRPTPVTRTARTSQHSNGSRPVAEMALDEFGSDDSDIDMDALEPIAKTNGSSTQPTRVTSAPGYIQSEHQSAPLTRASQPQRAASTGKQLTTIDEDLDDYGDEFDLEDFESAIPVSTSIEPDSGLQPVATVVHVAQEATNPPAPQIHDLTGFSDNDDDDDVDDGDDEFGGDDIGDDFLAEAEIVATQAQQASTGISSSTYRNRKPRAIQRYLVKQIVEGQYSDDRGRLQYEKVLLVEDEVCQSNKAITLRQSWYETHCTAGSYVHVVGDFSSTGQITINDADNMIIVHPDHLISATVVADSFECIRRAVLQDRVKSTNNTSEPTVYGSILHEVFQEAMKANRWDPDWLNAQVERTLAKFLESLFQLGHENTNKALEFLRSMLPELRSWASTFVKAEPGPDALAEDRGGRTVAMSITKLLDVEEHVWSPKYGLKGNIDATVQINMRDEEGQRALTVPFEVKTGRNTTSTSHRAQTALYTLLLSDRYDIDCFYGVLYYMKTSTMCRIPGLRNEIRSMIQQRNELASYVRERLQLPPMLQNPNKCGRCYAKTECFLYHKLAENGTAETSGAEKVFNELVGRLNPAHQEFFKKWDTLLTREESEMMKFRRELWTMLSVEREKLGRCFSQVVIEPGSAHENEDMQKINRFSYTFVKKQSVAGHSFTDSQITLGEPIVVSSEQGHFALANGYVTKVSSRRISVAVDRRLHNARKRQPGFDAQTKQSFAGIMEVTKECDTPDDASGERDQVVYRLDKDEFSNGMATVRNNLLAIMDDSVYRSADLRSLIVENTAPAFKPIASAYTLSGSASQQQMNPDQVAAVDKVMSARDYALVLGMPGTGKTTTIAHIIRALVARGKSVLLTSYTHTAVDNILLKLRPDSAKSKDKISVLRLGTLAKIHPEVQNFATLAVTPKDSLEEIENAYMRPSVVATTCLGVNHFLFQKRVFDYCIVDEASQITLPVCLGPIRMARTFVLVGDHYQLPPLVQNKDAAEGGLDVSLFKLLSEAQPQSVVELGRQYRMCEDVQHLANTLIYNGRLHCGTIGVAARTLVLPSPDGLARYHAAAAQNGPAAIRSSLQINTSTCTSIGTGTSTTTTTPCWLAHLTSPLTKVIFANTDTMVPSPQESAQGRRIINVSEAHLTAQLVLSFLARGVPAAEIGVITFYRSQLALLRQTLRAMAAASSPGLASGSGADAIGAVEMHTADKFQGRDKEVVIVSFVRANSGRHVGDLLKDWRRVNVAITRARSKLVLLGSPSTLAGNALLERLVGLCAERGWVYDLPAQAETMHGFEVTGTAASGVAGGGTATQNAGWVAGENKDREEHHGRRERKQSEARKPLVQTRGIENFMRKKSGGDVDLEDFGGSDMENAGVLAPVRAAVGMTEGVRKPFKVPAKTGTVNGNRRVMNKRLAKFGESVLADIVNDALGDVDLG